MSDASRVFPRNFVEHLHSLAATRAGDVALVVVAEHGGELAERSISYCELDRRVRALAAQLQRQFEPTDRALLLLDNDEHYVIAFFACLYAGLVAVPAFPPQSAHQRHLSRLTAMASDAQASCLLITEHVAERIRGAVTDFGGVPAIAVDAVDVSGADDWQPHEPVASDIAFLQYTSGSTSAPKGVMVSHGNLMANERAIERSLAVDDDDVFVSWLPLFHDMGLIGSMLQPIHRGIPLVLMTPQFFLERPARWLQAISRHRGTISGGPDFAYRLCLDRIKDSAITDLDLSGWRLAFSGAEPVRHDTLQHFTERFSAAGFAENAVYPCYGLAEATLLVSGSLRGAGMVATAFSTTGLRRGEAQPDPAGQTLVACGRVAEEHEISIRGDGDAVLGDGHIGEIWVSGPSVAAGYWNKPEATAETFVECRGRVWLRTGDLGFVHDRQLYVSGRVKDLIIVRGHNLYPQDIEQAIEAEVEAVRKGRVAAFAVAGAGAEGIGVAVEVSRNLQKLIAPEALVEMLGAVVGEACGESLSVVLLLNPGALPKTSSGKLRRRACGQGWLESTLDAYAIYQYGDFLKGGHALSATRPAREHDEIEAALVAIWAEVLTSSDADPITADAHFFTRGGNSIAATQVAGRIAERWALEFPVSVLFEHPRLSHCAAELRRRLAEPRRRSGGAAIPRLSAELRRAPLPPSHAQQRQWFLWQLEPDSSAYHIQAVLRLSGELDGDALTDALRELAQRHESLRTVFCAGADGRAEQVIVAEASLSLPLIDLRGAPAEAREARAAEVLRDLNAPPFDLRRPPLARGALIRLADDQHILALVVHHIVADGLSMQVLIDELGARYAAKIEGREPELAALPIQYADFAQWQRQCLEDGERDRQLAYWRQQLGDEHPVLLLPADRRRRAADRYRAARHDFVLPPALLEKLRNFADERESTLFMVLLAGFQVLLHRYSGQEDIRIGVPVANRQHPQTRKVIGFFVNTLVVRALFGERTTLAQTLEQTRRSTLEAQANQDIPFEQLVEALQPERSAGHSPLFQVMFNHLQEDLRPLNQLPGLSVSREPVTAEEIPFELTLNIGESLEHGGRVQAHFDYAVELFEPATIERLAAHYLKVLEALCSTPERSAWEPELLSGPEWQQLSQWGINKEHSPNPEPVHRLFERRAARQPQAPALVVGDEQLSYAELNRRANQLAHRLLAEGVGSDVRVGIALERSVELVVALLGVLKAGGSYVPLDPDYPIERLNYMIEDSGIALMLSHEPLRKRVPTPDTVKVLALDCLDLGDECEHDLTVTLSGDHLAYVIYTSGSTGWPKGVAVSHAALSMHVQAVIEAYGMTAADRELQTASINFDIAHERYLTTLLSGATAVLWNLQASALGELIEAVAEQRISSLFLPPAYLDEMVNVLAQQDRRLKLRLCVVGGEAWSREALSRALKYLKTDMLINAYGPTETVIAPTAWRVEDGFDSAIAPIGRPVGERCAYVLDAHLNRVPPGVEGELYLGGVGLARGYLNRAALTAERFVANPYANDGSRLYRSGDRVRWNADGQLEYLGRLDEQIKIRGLRIEPGEVATQLQGLAGVKDAVVVAQQSTGGLRLVGYVTAKTDQSLDGGALRTQLAAELPDYMVPAAIVILDTLPLTPNGKVDRKALPLPEFDSARTYEAPRGDVEETLATLWAETLGVERVGRNDNFFELGGHSLLALTLVERLREHAWQVPVKTLFRHPQLDAFARAIAEDKADAGQCEIAIPPNGIPADCSAITPEMLPLIELDAAAIRRIEVAVPGGATNIQDIYPLAPLQEGILFHHRLHDEGDAYVTQCTLGFARREALESFVAGFNRVIARHDILRTAVHWEGLPEPVQVVQREATLRLEWLQVKHGDEERRVAEQLAAQVKRIDVQRAPLLRAIAAHEPETDRWLLQLPSHHLVLDHSSLERIVEEIALIQQERADELPEPIPFRNFVARARLGSEAEHEAFFTQMLGDVDEPTAPFDLLDVRGDGSGIHEARVALSAELATELRQQARRQGVSAAALFHLAWALVLGRLTGKNDVVFGTVLFGRMQGGADVGRALGLFINTLPLRLRLGTQNVAESLQQAQQLLAELLDHEHASLSLAQRCSAVAGTTPLFSTLLNYRYTAQDTGEAAMTRWKGLEVLAGEERSNYPIGVSVDDLGDGFGLVAQVSDALDAGSICDYLHAAVRALVAALAEQPGQLLSELDILSPMERQQLQLWGENERRRENREPVHRLFEQQVARQPQAPALVVGDTQLGYAELNQRANQLAHHLRGHGVGPDVRVGIALERSPELVVALLGVLKAGGTYVPLDPDYPVERLVYLVEDSGIALLLTREPLRKRIPVFDAVNVLALDRLDLRGECEDNLTVELSGDHLAYVIYTSGSTGWPKGVAVSHGALSMHVQAIIEAYDMTAADRELQTASINFDIAHERYLTTLISGATVVLWNLQASALGELIEVVEEQRISSLFLPPAYLDEVVNLLAREGRQLTLRLCVVGGEAWSREALKRARRHLSVERLINAYGPTETVIAPTAWRVDGEIDSAIAPIGRPVGERCAYVLDTNLNRVPVGVAGELYLGGAGLARGYLNRPGLTAERFVANPFAANGERLYRSGDRVRWNADGQLEYLGRLDEQIKIRGLRIEPGEVAAQLQSLEGVKDAVVVAQHSPGGLRLVAYVTAQAGQSLASVELRTQLSRVLPDYLVPATIVILETLPLTPNGKVDRKALPEPEFDSVRAYEAPQGEVEQTLARLWAEVLGVDQVGRQDNFFELGGHSLLAVKVQAVVERQFDVSLPLRAIFETDSLAALAQSLADLVTKEQTGDSDELLQMAELLESLEN